MMGTTSEYIDEIIINGVLSVDTFFFLGGLLVAYMTFIEYERKRFTIWQAIANQPIVIVLRYLR